MAPGEEEGEGSLAPRRGFASLVGGMAGLFLGGVFLVAVWGKMFDPLSFAEVIQAEGLDFLLPAEPVAYLALGLEAAVGFALLLNLRRLWVLAPTAALVAFFLVLNGVAYAQYLRGEQPSLSSCGCFGHLVERTPAQAFWQDTLLLVPPLVLSFLGRPTGPFPCRRVGLLGVLTVGVVLFAWKAVDLPLDDFATRLSAGTRVAEACAGSGSDLVCLASEAVAPELLHGRHVVVLADLRDEAFAAEVGERLDEFLEWAGNAENPPILVLHPDGKAEETAFQFRSRAAPLEYRPAPRPLLRPLYRRLPRTFLVVDGMVTRTYDGLPSLSEICWQAGDP